MTVGEWEPDAPKSLADPGEVERRRAMAGLPHLAALASLLEGLRTVHGEVPDPDPLDGGAASRLLLLLETPGPRIRRTGFVSRDNPAETAANLFRFLREAGIARRDTLIWNAVPWVIHAPGALNRAPTRGEIAAGLAELPALIYALPELRCAVLAGRVAAGAAPLLRRVRPGLPVLLMPHPSPTFLCTSPAHPARVRAALGEAAAALRPEGLAGRLNSTLHAGDFCAKGPGDPSPEGRAESAKPSRGGDSPAESPHPGSKLRFDSPSPPGRDQRSPLRKSLQHEEIGPHDADRAAGARR